MSGYYPTVPTLGGSVRRWPRSRRCSTPSRSPTSSEPRTRPKPPKPSQSFPSGMRVPGLAQARATRTRWRTRPFPVISYRANTGDDPSGLGGPFQPRRTMTSAEIEAADGLSFTAAFSERLTGDRRVGDPSLANYASSPRHGAPRWLSGLAGRSLARRRRAPTWAEASWRSTSTTICWTPNASPSCIADDGRTVRSWVRRAGACQPGQCPQDGQLAPGRHARDRPENLARDGDGRGSGAHETTGKTHSTLKAYPIGPVESF